jgi:signal transduction histidine kinase
LQNPEVFTPSGFTTDMENFAATALLWILLALGFAGLLLLAWRYRVLYRRHQVLTRQAIALRAEMQSRVQQQADARAAMQGRLQDELGTLLATVKLSIKHSERKLSKAGVEGELKEAAKLLDGAIVMAREIVGKSTQQGKP